MEDDSQESVRFPVKGMESVLASVSGYHGTERFNLIRLISRAGASYVGNMNQNVTHLVCWKFEGRKYELAKRLKIVIVNHRWIEECVRKGRRVSEKPYTLQSGKDVGALLLDIPLVINRAKAQSKALNKLKEPVIDIDCEDINNSAWMDRILFDEDLFPQRRQNSHCSNRPIRKTIKKDLRKDCPSSSRYCLETLSGTRIMEPEEARASQPAYSSEVKKGKSTSPKSHCKRRKLVKKHASMKDRFSIVEEDCEEIQALPDNNTSGILSDSPDVERHRLRPNRQTSNLRRFLSGPDNSDDDIEEIEHVNDENRNAHAHGAASSQLGTSHEICEATGTDFSEAEPVNRQPASSGLSCVICWTDFSSTRGVLPCGHRFCFSCIQEWADHMVSRGKPSTCPLCKASFVCINKVDDALYSDQKIYSQSIPFDSLKMGVYILPDEAYRPPANSSPPVCCHCSNREPEDLLVRCNSCEIRCIHSFCLDPLLLPWTCVHCKDLQMLYIHSR